MFLPLIRFCLPLALLIPFVATAQPPGPAGLWGGAIEVPGGRLSISIQLDQAPPASWTGTISIPVQGLKNFALSEIEVEGTSVRFAMPGIPGEPRFDGILDPAGNTISGSFRQGPSDLKFSITRDQAVLAPKRPQTPVAPFPYTARDVTFPNPGAEITLAGTLLIPEGTGPFPGVVFITGSGPQDRDETLLAHKPFLVIADHLARHGIASLRYDDRGVGESQGEHLTSTLSDFASDAAAALSFFIEQPEIDRNGTGFLGHSEGGLSGPVAAVGNPRAGFLVLLAPPGVPLTNLLIQQNLDLLAAFELDPALLAKAEAFLREDLALIVTPSLSDEELREALQARGEARLEALTEAERTALQYDSTAMTQMIDMVSSPWFRSLLREDPAIHLRQFRGPVLALFGENDLQVAAEPNAAGLTAALAEAANPDVTVEILPGLNHLFQHSESGLPTEYGLIEETFAPQALDRISTWITERFAESR